MESSLSQDIIHHRMFIGRTYL